MLAEVLHQKEGVRFLRRFVEGGLTSPVLLVGPAGVGRRFSVMQAIQESFCTGTKENGCTCYSCFILPQGTHPDVVRVDAGEKDIGIDDVRELIAQAKDYPSSASIRCFVIDGADRFTGPAANAFLKTLEEPPARSRFFLLSETIDQVLPTIRSRCGFIRYAALPEAFVLSVLHRYETDAKALVYARMGEGSVGSAIQYWASGRLGLRDQVLKVLQLALDKDLPSLFAAVDAMDKDLALSLKFLDHLLHDVLIIRVDPSRVINVDRSDTLKEVERQFSPKILIRLANRVRALQSQYRSTHIHLPFHLKTILVDSFV